MKDKNLRAGGTFYLKEVSLKFKSLTTIHEKNLVLGVAFKCTIATSFSSISTDAQIKLSQDPPRNTEVHRRNICDPNSRDSRQWAQRIKF